MIIELKLSGSVARAVYDALAFAADTSAEVWQGDFDPTEVEQMGYAQQQLREAGVLGLIYS